MGQAKPFGAKLFLEGIEVPFIGATITHTINQASIAYIDLVPHKTINHVKPRTLVELAVRDFNNPEQDYPYVTAWEGEVFGHQMGKTTTSRTFTISCIDFSSYWDNVLAYFFNAQQSLGKGAGGLLGIGLDEADVKKLNLRFEAVTHSNTSYFRQVIDEKLKEPGSDFLDALVELYRRIANVNEFYNLSEARLRIIDRILLHSSGRLSELLSEQEALDWFTNVAGRQTGFTSLRAIIQDLMSIIFHDFVSVPFPARVTNEKITGASLKQVGEKKKTIGSFVFKPNLYMIPPPVCNVFFPDEYSAFQYSRNFFKEPTRLIYKPELPQLSGAGSVSLPHVYQPESFENYMLGTKPWKDFVGSGNFDVSGPEYKGDFLFNNENPSETKINKNLREQDFLTNEEKLKGIWLSQEAMVPATSQFRANLSDAGKRTFAQRVSKYLFYKKRFQERACQITSQLKLSVVPGFNVLILDDSDAEQNIVAYCWSVTHRIYATEGGYTNVSLSYARTVDEQDSSSNRGGEPLVPPWFEEHVFGKMEKGTSEVAKKEVEDAGVVHTSTAELSEFYKTLLGDKGYQAITNRYKKENTLTGSTKALLKEYREFKTRGGGALQDFIAAVTSRDYVRVRDCFRFLGASTPTKDLRFDNFIEFRGDQLSAVGRSNESVVKDRRAIIENYRNALKEGRGFRG